MNVITLIERAGGVPQLAARLGISRPTVLGWRAAGFVPGSRIAQISAELDIEPGELLELVQRPRARGRGRE